MPAPRLLHPIALGALLSLSACGPDLVSSDDGGDEPVVHPNEPLPPVALDDWCDDSEALLPFADHGQVNRLEGLGPCGHLLTWNFLEDESIAWTLWYPDGRVVPLGTAPGIESDLFSPTGRLLAWAERESEPMQGVTIRDLRTDESRTIETQGLADYGFVRIPDSEPGAALWLCAGDVLELVGVASEDSHVLAEDVRCDTVTGGELTTRLIYVDQHDVLHVVDAKAKTAWSTDVNAGPWLRLSPDGRLAFAGHEEDSDDVPAPLVDLDRGELVASCEDLRFKQALTSTAPLFVQCDGELSVWRDDALVLVHDEVFQWTVSPSIDGSATFRRQLGSEDEEELWLAPAEDPSAARLIVAYPADEPLFLERSANGQHGRLRVETSACANASCSETITELRSWTPAGVGATMFAAGDWKQLHVFDDGQALGYGTRIDGPLPEGVPVPLSQLVLAGPDGTATTTWSIAGEPWYAWPLDDDRLLLRVRYGAQDYVLVFDRNAPELATLLGPVDFASTTNYLDPRLGLLAIAVQADMGLRLYWGAVFD
jgi:hypothetical protein